MGVVRFALAMLVVYFHVEGERVFGIRLPSARIAVQIFYVISGFYMALILNRKYDTAATNNLFYSNRFFRLWPPMMVVISLVIVQFAVTGKVLLLQIEMGVDQFLAMLSELDWTTLAYLAFANVFVFGQDWLWFLSIGPGSTVNWCPAFSCIDHNGSSFLLDHPTFTVAIEATYYLVSPFVLRRSFSVALALAGLGLAWHVYVFVAGLHPLVWGYHFVGSAAFFYFLGACAYHAYARYSELPESSMARLMLQRYELLVYPVGMLLALAIYVTAGAIRNLMIAVIVALLMPLLFDRTRAYRLDRLVGELSFGIYLIHIPLFHLLLSLYGSTTGAVLTLGLVVPAAILLHVSVEAPVDRWRQRRAASAGIHLNRRSSSQQVGTSGAG